MSPDGKQLIALNTASGQWALMPLGSGASRPLPQIRSDDRVIDFTPDAAGVLLLRVNSSGGVDILRVELNGGKTSLVRTVGAVPGASQGIGLQVTASRDGKSYAYEAHPAASIEYLVRGLK